MTSGLAGRKFSGSVRKFGAKKLIHVRIKARATNPIKSLEE